MPATTANCCAAEPCSIILECKLRPAKCYMKQMQATLVGAYIIATRVMRIVYRLSKIAHLMEGIFTS